MTEPELLAAVREFRSLLQDTLKILDTTGKDKTMK
jgi:hypothetical protein